MSIRIKHTPTDYLMSVDTLLLSRSPPKSSATVNSIKMLTFNDGTKYYVTLMASSFCLIFLAFSAAQVCYSKILVLKTYYQSYCDFIKKKLVTLLLFNFF